MINSILILISYTNIILEITIIVFISFVFFDLLFVDKQLKLSELSEKFEKFKRYDIFKSSLIFLVLSLYFTLFAKLSHYFGLPTVTFDLFSLLGNIFLLLFSFKLYQLIHKYVPKVKA